MWRQLRHGASSRCRLSWRSLITSWKRPDYSGQCKCAPSLELSIVVVVSLVAVRFVLFLFCHRVLWVGADDEHWRNDIHCVCCWFHDGICRIFGMTCWFFGQHECTAIDNAVLRYIPLVPWSGTPLNTSLVSPLTVAFWHLPVFGAWCMIS